MSITRKEFFRQGFFAMGKTVLDVAETLHGNQAPFTFSQPPMQPDPVHNPGLMAEAFNERCLAQNCGCFACAERCQPMAIQVVPGKGILIDELRCTGCGMCEYVCPVTPKAVILSPRKTV